MYANVKRLCGVAGKEKTTLTPHTIIYVGLTQAYANVKRLRRVAGKEKTMLTPHTIIYVGLTYMLM